MTATSSAEVPRAHDGPKVAGLAALITIACVGAYLALIFFSGDDGYLRAVGFLGLILLWLTSIAVITMKLRVSALWALGGMVLGFVFTPITWITYLVVYVALGGEFFHD